MYLRVFLEFFVLDKNGYPLQSKYEMLSQNVDEVLATIANASFDLTYACDETGIVRRQISELMRQRGERALTPVEEADLNEAVIKVADALAYRTLETTVVLVYRNIRLHVWKGVLGTLREKHLALNRELIKLTETSDTAYNVIGDWPKVKPTVTPSLQKAPAEAKIQPEEVSAEDLPPLPRNTQIPVQELKNYDLTEKNKGKKPLTKLKK